MPFMENLSQRLANRVQLTTDGLRVYLNAVEGAFGANIDYAMLVKIYGETSESEKRYSPAQCIGCKHDAISGNPDPKHISTSYIERQRWLRGLNPFPCQSTLSSHTRSRWSKSRTKASK
jgi:hypothetical protein